MPFGERHSVTRLGHGFYRIQVRLGFMQTPDIPLTLLNCNRLGFDADLEHQNYYVAHETIVRRRDQAGDGADVVFDVLVPQPHLQPRAGFFQDPAGRDYRGGISGEGLTIAVMRVSAHSVGRPQSRDASCQASVHVGARWLEARFAAAHPDGQARWRSHFTSEHPPSAIGRNA